ncbi:hypothetical protein M885DRAFT_468528 [Pelagophyceae sp. CCMP2097]|nr:hypothetical protein M885DRAFT_468528 [Pelagophyceae sp. CCMP2097]
MMLLFLLAAALPRGAVGEFCGVGKYDPGIFFSCAWCAAGRYSTNDIEDCLLCNPGSHAPRTGSGHCAGCPAGRYENRYGSQGCLPCSPGKSSFEPTPLMGAIACSNCASGKYAASSAQPTCGSCSPGKFATADSPSLSCEDCRRGKFASGYGASVCQLCAAGSVSKNSGMSECELCQAGTFSEPGYGLSCPSCPTGKSSAVGAASCTACSAGKYAGFGGMPQCLACPAGMTSVYGASSCTSCTAGRFASSGDSSCTSCGVGNWEPFSTGAKSQADCVCAVGYTGKLCNVEGCSPVQRGASLGGLLLEAAWPEPTRDLSNKEMTFNTILRSADTNGDNYLSNDEASKAIKSMHMAVPDVVTKLWSRQVEGEFVFKDFDEKEPEEKVTITEMVQHTMLSRTTVELYQHGGAEGAALSGMAATYPAADWTQPTCVANKDTADTGGVDWTWQLDTSEKTLYRQCIYRNGELVDGESFSKGMADGSACIGSLKKKCSVHDPDGISGDSRKRLYCAEALFCPRDRKCDEMAAVVNSLTEMRCSTGLLYDGSPADVVPALISSTGVRFAWLDTSTDEQGFQIFRSPVDALAKTTLIADIPTKSKSCGQPFSPISYYDRDVGDVPGTHVMYTVSTVGSDGDPKESTTALFTSPWVGTLTVAVTSESGSPVRDVTVVVNHLLDDGTVDDKYSPLLSGDTDNYGEFESEIRVTDRDWTAVKQHFLIQVSKSTLINPGEFETNFQHVFAPSSMQSTLQHFQSTTVDFVDKSTVSISGVVRYDLDPKDFGGAGDCAYSTEASGCYCPVLNTVVLVDRGGGDVESFPTHPETGAFKFSAAYNSIITVRLEGFNGLGGVGRNHTFRLDAVSGDAADPSRSSPSTTFVATQDTVLEFVATDEVEVRVGVLGGGEGVAYVHGQPVVFGLAGCKGFQRKLFTYMGYASTVLPPAPKHQLRLGATDAPCSSRKREEIIDTFKEVGLAGCRAEMPYFPDSDNATRPCATSKFQYIDDFFTEVGTARNVDLSTLGANETKDAVHDELYYFAAPVCVDKVEVQSAQLQDLNRWATGEATKRTPSLTNRSESMLLQPPQPEEDGPEPYGSTCFGKNSLGGVFVEGDTFLLKFDLVERHPEPLAALLWPWSFELENGVVVGLKGAAKGPVHDFVESKPLAGAAISVVVNDGISGEEPEPATYNLDVADFGYAHRVAVGDPNPFTPFTKVVFFVFEREIDGAKVDFTRHAIVLGVIQDAVPQIFMMATDPTLIFTVLRDPPGGDSFATITEGTEMSMSMAISGMHAAGHAYEKTTAGSAGVSVRLGVALGVSNLLVDLKTGVGSEHSLTGPAVGASRAQSQAHDLTFTFDLAVSTSTDPFLAGQPSDVIVGGGANLRVLTAIKVDIQNKADDMYCVSGARTYEWLPEQVSTFVATVYEIERTMVRLGVLISDYEPDDVSEDVIKSRAALANWQTVLKDYRAATLESETTLAGGIAATLAGYKAKFAAFSAASEDGDSAFSAYLAEGLSDLSESDHLSRSSLAVPGANSISKEGVSSYAASVSKFLAATEANCKVGDMFGLGDLCKTHDLLSASGSAAHKLLGVCDFETDVARPAAVQAWCMEREFSAMNDVAMGAVEAPRSAFDALSNVGRLITFSGTNPVEFEYSVGETAARSTDVGFTTDGATSYGLSKSLCANLLRSRRLTRKVSTSVDKSLSEDAGKQDNAPSFCRRLADIEAETFRRRLGIGVNADISETWGSSFGVELSRSSSSTNSETHSVTVNLGDPSPYDFFAVKIAQDPVHGTPIFTTMGGQSSCPGETGTTKVDSRVTIASLEYHCGDSFKPRADCDDLEEGAVATIGIILQNLSPSLRPVQYRLDVQQSSPWNAGKYYGGEAGYCGQAGDSGGLKFSINGERPSQYKLDDLPYGQREVLLTVEKTHPFCFEFSDISITLTSQCEYDADDVYQYRTALGEEKPREVRVVHPIFATVSKAAVYAGEIWDLDANGEPTAALSADQSETTFSVAWRRFRPMTTPEPTTRFPTRAPTVASLSVSIAVVSRVAADSTQSSYCADLESSGVVEVQAAVVFRYVVDQFGFEPMNSTALCADGARAEDVSVVVSLALYASDVVDRATGRTAKSFADELSFVVSRKITTGAWVEDQRAAISRAKPQVPGRRLSVDVAWAFKIVEAAQYSNKTAVADLETLQPSLSPTVSKSPVFQPTPKPSISPRPTRAPRTYAAAPSDDDDDAADAMSPGVLAILVLVSILVGLNCVVAAVLLAPHCGGGGARLKRLSAGLKSFRRRKKEHCDDPKIEVGGGDTEMADRAAQIAVPRSPLHR